MDILIENLIHKGVSTIPDECKGVGLEIGTSSKRKTTLCCETKNEDIVSSDGDIWLKCVEQQMDLTSTLKKYIERTFSL